MNDAVRRALRALTLLLAGARVLAAQDSTSSFRDSLPIDLQRLAPFVRHYDIVVESRDSIRIIGQRTLSVQRATFAGAAAWVLVEARTGISTAVDSLFVSPALHPIHWTSTMGAARLGAQFARDSIYGVTTSPGARQNIIMPAPSTLLVSGAMVEVVLSLLPLAAGWTDSVAILAIDPTSAAVVPAQLIAFADEMVTLEGASPRPAAVVALRTDPAFVLFWLDRETGAIVRVQQALRGGVFLEYRLRNSGGSSPP